MTPGRLSLTPFSQLVDLGPGCRKARQNIETANLFARSKSAPCVSALTQSGRESGEFKPCTLQLFADFRDPTNPGMVAENWGTQASIPRLYAPA
jgi:hypothetical protein